MPLDDATLAHRRFSSLYWSTEEESGGLNKSRIFGGGARAGGPIFLMVVVSYVVFDVALERVDC